MCWTRSSVLGGLVRCRPFMVCSFLVDRCRVCVCFSERRGEIDGERDDEDPFVLITKPVGYRRSVRSCLAPAPEEQTNEREREDRDKPNYI